MDTMRIKSRLMLYAAALAVCFITGCADKYTAIYTFPPSGLKGASISAISPLKIEVSAALAGNATMDKGGAEAMLRQRISSRLYQEGALKTIDLLWGTRGGGDKVANVFAPYHSAHGYARYVSDDIECAVLHINVKAAMVNKIDRVKRKFRLVDIPYKIKREEGRVPVSRPDFDNRRVEEREVTYDVLRSEGMGVLQATLVDKGGKTVFSKNFPIAFKHVNDLESHEAQMAGNALFDRMIANAVEELAMDISPHQETREIKFNESGCKKAVLLLKAQAISETVNFLENYSPMKEADYENLGLAYEILGEYTLADDAYKQGKCEERIRKLSELRAKIEEGKAGK